MKSLADFLDVQDPRTPEQLAQPEPKVEDVLDVADPKEFCEKILGSRQFRQYILNGIVIGDLPSAIVTRMMDHGWGKPVERVQVQAVQDLDGLSPSELRALLQERIKSLATMVSLLEDGDETVH